jgi:hypothetical protein
MKYTTRFRPHGLYSLLLLALLALGTYLPTTISHAAGKTPRVYFYTGYSAIINDPEDTGNTTFHGVALGGGYILDGRHFIGLETGYYLGDRGIHEEWGGHHYRESYDRDTSLIPVLLSYNYVHQFNEKLSLSAGPIGGLFIAINSESWQDYDRYRDDYYYDSYYDNGWRSRERHSKGNTFWGAGANLGLSCKLNSFLQLDFGYRFLYASSFEVWGIRTGNSYNHQILLTVKAAF